MQIRKKLCCLAVVLGVAFCCRVRAGAAVDTHIVSRVDVVCRSGGKVLQRQYRRDHKMEAILNYLRLAEYAGLPAAAPDMTADMCRITVHLVPGGSHRYDLLQWQYLSRDGSPWELAEMPEGLPWLLRQLPSDT